MTPEQQVVTDIKAHIATLPAETQAWIAKYAGIFRVLVELSYEAQLAFALAGAEMSAGPG